MQRLLTQQEILSACKIMELSPDLFIRGGRDANNALRASYIELVKRHHPDVKRHPMQSHPDKGSPKHSLTFYRNRPSPVISFESENKFADIQRAYNTLKTHLESRRIERASLWSFSSAPGFINRVPNPEDIQSILRSARPVPMHESGSEPIHTNALSGPPPPPSSFDGRVVPRPAHRAFLSFEGVGFGSQSERSRQFERHRTMRANDAALEYRMRSDGRDSSELAPFDSANDLARLIRTGSSIERVVEDLVQEAMQRGEFANLRGAGRPLPYDADGHSLFVDRTELALNRILARQGFVPEWVQLRRTIRRELDEATNQLASSVRKPRDQVTLAREREKFNARIRELNTKHIRRHNLILPGPLAARLQMLQVDAEALGSRVIADPSAHLLQVHPENARDSADSCDCGDSDSNSIDGVLPPPEPSLGKVLWSTLAHFVRSIFSVFTLRAFRSSRNSN